MRVRFYIAEGGHTSSISAPEDDVVRVKGKDSYERLVHKTLAILRDGAQSGCGWVIKTDIDTYIRPLFLAEQLDALDARAPPTGKKGDGGGGGGGNHAATSTTTTAAAPAAATTGGGGGAAGVQTVRTTTPHGPLTLVGHIWGHSRAHYTGVWEMDRRFYSHAHYPPYAGGPLYALSHTLAHAVSRYLHTHPTAVPEYGPEDATVGVLVRRAVTWMDGRGMWGAEEGARRSGDGAAGALGGPPASSPSSPSASSAMLPSSPAAAVVVVDARDAVSSSLPPSPPSPPPPSAPSSPSTTTTTTTSSIEYLNLWPFNPSRCDSRVVAVNPINSATPTNFWALHAYELESPNGLCDAYRFGMHYGRSYLVSVDLHDPGVVGDGAGRLKTEPLPWEVGPTLDTGGGGGGGGSRGGGGVVIKGREHLLLSSRALQQTHRLSSSSSSSSSALFDATHASLTHLFTHTHAQRPHTTHTDVSSHWSVASSSNDTHTHVLGVRGSGDTIASLHRATRARPEVDVVVVMADEVVCGCPLHDDGGGGGGADGKGSIGTDTVDEAGGGVDAVEALETFFDAVPWDRRMRVIVARRACDAHTHIGTPTLAQATSSQTQTGTTLGGAAEAHPQRDGHAQTQADAARQRGLDAALRAVVGSCGGNRCMEVVVRGGSDGGGGSTPAPISAASTTTAKETESNTRATHPLSLLESVKPLLRREALVVVVDVRTRLTHTHLHHALALAVKGRSFFAGMPLPPSSRLPASAARDGRPSGSYSSSLPSSPAPLTRGGMSADVGGGDGGDTKNDTAERTATGRRLRRGGGSGGQTGGAALQTHTPSEIHTHARGCVDSAGHTPPQLLSEGITHLAAHARDFVRVRYDHQQVASDHRGERPFWVVDRILSAGYHVVRAYEDGEGGGR